MYHYSQLPWGSNAEWWWWRLLDLRKSSSVRLSEPLAASPAVHSVPAASEPEWHRIQRKKNRNKTEKDKRKLPSEAADVLNDSPPPSAPLCPSPPPASPSLSVGPPLSPSAGFPAVPAAASGGPRGEGTPGEQTLAPLLRAAAQTGLQGTKKQTWDIINKHNYPACVLQGITISIHVI